MTPRTIRLAILAVLLALWFAATALGWASPIILASPRSIVTALIKDFPSYYDGLLVTLGEIGASILIAWSAGVALGLAVGRIGALSRIAEPLLSAAFSVPLIILYPLLLAWVGIGWESKVVFGVLSGFFPIALNTLASVRRVDKRYSVMARAMGARDWQVLGVVVRLALPGIVSGLRVGTALIVIGVVVTEMLASTGGLGYLISYNTNLFETGHVYLGIALALVVVVVLNKSLAILETRLTGWRMPEQGTQQPQ
jgi:NitT/TauT family transport system permease protein/taurine transport system permease protein